MVFSFMNFYVEEERSDCNMLQAPINACEKNILRKLEKPSVGVCPTRKWIRVPPYYTKSSIFLRPVNVSGFSCGNKSICWA
jgi:hypothetical protein